MLYSAWVSEHYQNLYELYFHVIIPFRASLQKKQAKFKSKVTFDEFCYLAYTRHGFERVA